MELIRTNSCPAAVPELTTKAGTPAAVTTSNVPEGFVNPMPTLLSVETATTLVAPERSSTRPLLLASASPVMIASVLFDTDVAAPDTAAVNCVLPSGKTNGTFNATLVPCTANKFTGPVDAANKVPLPPEMLEMCKR